MSELKRHLVLISAAWIIWVTASEPILRLTAQTRECKALAFFNKFLVRGVCLTEFSEPIQRGIQRPPLTRLPEYLTIQMVHSCANPDM